MKCPKPSLWYQFTSTEEQGHTFGSVLVHPCEQKMKVIPLRFVQIIICTYLTKETQYQMQACSQRSGVTWMSVVYVCMYKQAWKTRLVHAPPGNFFRNYML